MKKSTLTLPKPAVAPDPLAALAAGEFAAPVLPPAPAEKTRPSPDQQALRRLAGADFGA